jgi:uncharacterized membrane protein
MAPVDDRPDAISASDASNAARVSALEQQVAALTADVAALRAIVGTGSAHPHHDERRRGVTGDHPLLHPDLAVALRTRAHRAKPAITSEELESLVGRYGTLLFAALVILMGVGVLIRVAISHGLLTPEVRVGIGALIAAGVGGAGLYFHRRGEVRYGNVLLALSLAIADLVAWGAGPRFHLVPTSVALAVVDVIAIAMAALALRDESEFLFCIAVGGALSAPFVTTDNTGTAAALLAYGAFVLLGALRAVRDPHWPRAFAVMVGGSLLYALAAAAMPLTAAWYAPFAIVLFGGVCALGAFLFAHRAWRGVLARAYLGVALVGVPVGWDRIGTGPSWYALGVAVALATVTYAALLVRRPRQPLWVASALLLPLLSLAVASADATTSDAEAGVFALWALFALVAWGLERARHELRRGGAHLLAGGLLGAVAVSVFLWSTPLLLVFGLAAWGVLLAVAVKGETSLLPLIGVGVALGAASMSAMDQLASRAAFAYVPFMTRSSASALLATLGLGIGGLALAWGKGAPAQWADRPVRLAVLIGFAILWGRMEVAQAFNRDVASFLLIAYYAACGLASIIVGRQLGIARLRFAGLALAIYAAVKAVAEASEIGGVMLRVAAYGAVGVFLLGAGYLYRERATERVGTEISRRAG